MPAKISAPMDPTITYCPRRALRTRGRDLGPKIPDDFEQALNEAHISYLDAADEVEMKYIAQVLVSQMVSDTYWDAYQRELEERENELMDVIDFEFDYGNDPEPDDVDDYIWDPDYYDYGDYD